MVGVQLPFVVALVAMGLAMVVVVVRTFGAGARSHAWQDRGKGRR